MIQISAPLSLQSRFLITIPQVRTFFFKCYRITREKPPAENNGSPKVMLHFYLSIESNGSPESRAAS